MNALVLHAKSPFNKQHAEEQECRRILYQCTYLFTFICVGSLEKKRRNNAFQHHLHGVILEVHNICKVLKK